MFSITLSNDVDTKEVFFNLYNTDIALRWLDELKKGYEIYENDRFTNWPNSHKTEIWFIDWLNRQIDIVNSYDNVIDIKICCDTGQHVLNTLHKHFENLRGHIEIGTDWFNTAPDHVKAAVERFNILIHEYESYKKNCNAKTGHPYASIVCTFKNKKRILLLPDDYTHFTYCWKFAEVYINYCEVGKPLLDVFVDQDEVVGDDAIRPQSHYSADFMIKFGQDTNKLYFFLRQIRFNWWCWKNNMFKKYRKGQVAAGMIPVAKINLQLSGYRDYNPMNIVSDLSIYNKIIKISCMT